MQYFYNTDRTTTGDYFCNLFLPLFSNSTFFAILFVNSSKTNLLYLLNSLNLIVFTFKTYLISADLNKRILLASTNRTFPPYLTYYFTRELYYNEYSFGYSDTNRIQEIVANNSPVFFILFNYIAAFNMTFNGKLWLSFYWTSNSHLFNVSCLVVGM